MIDTKKIDRRYWHEAMSKHLAGHGPEALKAEDVAKLLNVSLRHVYKLVEEKKIPHIKIGNAIRFDALDISKWVENMAREQNGGDELSRKA